MYILTLNNGASILYKSTGACKVSKESVSFLDRENGRISFWVRHVIWSWWIKRRFGSFRN